ncbi:MAG TPA: hypothetical protein VLK33_05010 [Terriglobales bacterium]|nr:hypothetical protein [Terriglobales bacterium]
MKKLLALVLGLTVMCSVAAFAQDAGTSAGSTDKSTMSNAPLKTIKGTVKAEGDKVTFVSDDDQKSWEVENPDTLKAHDGHHVQVTAHVDADKMAIHVMKVKMLKGSSM